jgi:hypothetical protein
MSWFSFHREETPNQNPRLNPLAIDFTTADLLDDDAIQNAKDAVALIQEQHPAPYTLFASGGIDSQAMMLAWKMLGAEFKVVHYSYGTNSTDTSFIVDFCVRNRIPFDLLMFDAKAFIESAELVELAKRYDCSSPQILTYIKLVSRHPETCVMAGNFIDDANSGLNWTLLGLQRFAEIDKQNFVPFFFLSTPKLAYSFVRGYRSKMLEQFHSHPRIRDSYSAKVDAYHQAGFQVKAQPSKLTGFEELKAQYDSIKIPAHLRLKWNKMPSKRAFDVLYRYSLYDAIGLYSEQVKPTFTEHAINTLANTPD